MKQSPVTLVNGMQTEYVSVDDLGLNYGDGLFETIAVYNNQAVFWAEHWLRLQQGCQRLDINCPAENIVYEEVTSVIARHSRAVVKIIITRGRSDRGYRYDNDHTTTRIVRLFPWPTNCQALNKSGVALKYSVYPLVRSELAGIKHLNRLEQVLATAELNKTQYDEIICCDENDNIVECSSANIFFVIDNVLHTPQLDGVGIKGIIRDWVVKYAGHRGMRIKETRLNKSNQEAADEVFITNSVIGVRPVIRIEYTDYTVGGLTGELQTAYAQKLTMGLVNTE